MIKTNHVVMIFIIIFILFKVVLSLADVSEGVFDLPLGIGVEDFKKKVPEAVCDPKTGNYHKLFKNGAFVVASFTFKNVFNQETTKEYLWFIKHRLATITLLSPYVSSEGFIACFKECVDKFGQDYKIKIATDSTVSNYPKYISIIWKLRDKKVHMLYMPKEEFLRFKNLRIVHELPLFFILITRDDYKTELNGIMMRELNEEEKNIVRELGLEIKNQN